MFALSPGTIIAAALYGVPRGGSANKKLPARRASQRPGGVYRM